MASPAQLRHRLRDVSPHQDQGQRRDPGPWVPRFARCADRWQRQTVADLATHVPYKGAGPAVSDVIAGHAQALVADLPVLAPHLKSGKLRALAITGLDRTPLFPDIPSMKELGYPQVNSRNWYALLAPARTPPEIVTRLNAAVRQAVAAPVVRDRLVELGAEIFTQSPEEFGKFLKSEIERWKGVVAKYNIAVQP